MRHPSAPVVPDDGESFVAEGAHHRDGIGGHGAFGVGFVALASFGLRGIAVTAQIHRDDTAMLRKAGTDVKPGRERLRMAVKQQDRRAGAAGASMDRDPGAVSMRWRAKPGRKSAATGPRAKDPL